VDFWTWSFVRISVSLEQGYIFRTKIRGRSGFRFLLIFRRKNTKSKIIETLVVVIIIIIIIEPPRSIERFTRAYRYYKSIVDRLLLNLRKNYAKFGPAERVVVRVSTISVVVRRQKIVHRPIEQRLFSKPP